MRTFYITFGFTHPLAKHVLELQAEDENQARLAASTIFPQWANILHAPPEDDRTVIQSAKNAETALRSYQYDRP
jgi:hypothetical protein